MSLNSIMNLLKLLVSVCGLWIANKALSTWKEEIKAKLEEHGLTLGMTDYSHLKDVDLGKHKDENE